MDGVSRVFTISTSFVIVMSTHGDCISYLASIDTFRNVQTAACVPLLCVY